MNAMIFAYVEARQLEIERLVQRRQLAPDLPSVRDRVGRALIAIGEQLISSRPEQAQEIRTAA